MYGSIYQGSKYDNIPSLLLGRPRRFTNDDYLSFSPGLLLLPLVVLRFGIADLDMVYLKIHSEFSTNDVLLRNYLEDV